MDAVPEVGAVGLDNGGDLVSSSNSNSGGLGFSGFLTLIFIVLKLTHVITWAWIWVLAPLWMGFILAAFFMTVFGLLYLLATKTDVPRRRKRSVR